MEDIPKTCACIECLYWLQDMLTILGGALELIEADQATGVMVRMRRAEWGQPTTSHYKSLPHQAPQLKMVAIDMHSVNCGPWCLIVILLFFNTSRGWSK